MAQINLDIPDELLNRIAEGGQNPADFFQSRLLEISKEVTEPGQSVTVQKFKFLADRWRRETRHSSLVSDIVLNSAYQQIIGMGLPAVPLILQELKNQPDHWFWALRSIVGESPISPKDRGRLSSMAEAWLTWGREHGYQC